MRDAASRMERRSKWQGTRPTRLLYCAAVILTLAVTALHLPLYRGTVTAWEPNSRVEHIQLDRLEAIQTMPERRIDQEMERPVEPAAADAARRVVQTSDDLRLAVLSDPSNDAESEGHAESEAGRVSAWAMRAMSAMQPASLQADVSVEPLNTPIELTAHADGPPSIGEPPSVDPTSLDVHYPEKARRRGVQGRVILAFLVDKDGRAYDIRIVHPLFPACDEAAIEAVRGARFTPGRTNGRSVPALARLAIRFQLRTS